MKETWTNQKTAPTNEKSPGAREWAERGLAIDFARRRHIYIKLSHVKKLLLQMGHKLRKVDTTHMIEDQLKNPLVS